MSFQIRLAQADDADAIRSIYNDFVIASTATLETQSRSASSQQLWMAQHDGAPYPCFVAELASTGVVGWASLSPYNPKPGYRGTAENSVYVAPVAQGQGIGEALLRQLQADAPSRQIETIIALITADNRASIQLHEKCGFRLVGTLERVGRKFGQLVDVTLLQWHAPPSSSK